MLKNERSEILAIRRFESYSELMKYMADILLVAKGKMSLKKMTERLNTAEYLLVLFNFKLIASNQSIKIYNEFMQNSVSGKGEEMLIGLNSLLNSLNYDLTNEVKTSGVNMLYGILKNPGAINFEDKGKNVIDINSQQD